MFERFTTLARLSIAQAVVESRELGHDFVGTEHQLLGLLQVREGVAHQVLEDAGVSYELARKEILELVGVAVDKDALADIGIDLEAVRQAAEMSFGPGALDSAVAGHRRSIDGSPFTSRAKKVIALALREAINLKHGSIGTEHLLLAMVREGDGVSAEVLRRLAPDTDFRQVVLQRIRNAS
jgi:ATP-dependent Clp protease ATP-binding subunit ClpA